MHADPYSACPCGSGKKFKWCCQPIYPGIQHALEQAGSGQVDHALQLMEQVTREHAGNPEAWGQYARLLLHSGKPEQAEEALEKAFAINPNYPFGLLLRASLRQNEGEFRGALLLARKAAEAYDPQTQEPLGQVYSIIFDCEMRCARPVAARAALEQLVHLQPADDNLRQSLEAVFGEKSRLPEAARKRYDLHAPAANRREAWNRVMGTTAARISELAKGFERVTQDDPKDGPGWFNLGLARAWLGENQTAVEALDHAIELEDEAAAVEAATLVEVLRCGHGMDEQCDYHEYSSYVQIRNPEPINALLREWAQSGRLIQIPVEQEGIFHALILELTTSGIVTAGRPASDAGVLAGSLTVVNNILRVASPVKEPFARLREEMRKKLALPLNELQERVGPIPLQEVPTESLIFPTGPQEPEAATQRILDHAARFYEETWIHRPRRSLNNIAPVDAAGSPRLRRKLLGVIAFVEQCSRGAMAAEYDFNRLRRKVGLVEATAAPTPAAGTAPSVAADVSAMGAAELAALKSETLADEQLEQAYQAAHRLDANELAAHFAGALVARPVQPGRPDRYPFYSFLVQKALKEGAGDEALDRVNEGERVDCEHNEGKRRNDYELRRAQVHTGRGEADAAQDVFQRLVERTPANLRIRGQAAEAMLKLKQPARALKFAEDGVTAARAANDRDSEQYLMELVSAAKRQTG
jgi:tetratricopeptide (TPR) repeat protein